ncbi:hypothetical protein MGH68_19475 [Erysipelothrix sp. D19-032]
MNTTVADSPYYESWVASTEAILCNLKKSVKNHDIDRVGEIAQTNALKMHASLMAVNMWYFEPMTVEIMNRVRQLQKSIPKILYNGRGTKRQNYDNCGSCRFNFRITATNSYNSCL